MDIVDRTELMIAEEDRLLDLKQKILDKATVDDKGCWLWKGKDNGSGYGRITVGGERWYAHRLSWTVYVGTIPDGLEIDHLCRVRNCVNPNHLQPVSAAINTYRGNTARLSIADVLAIRDDPRLHKEIAQSYGVHPSQVSKIKARKQWAWLHTGLIEIPPPLYPPTLLDRERGVARAA